MNTIVDLMEELEGLALHHEPHLGSHDKWIPDSQEGQRIFSELIDETNREALKSWYAQFQGVTLNPAALNLKASLEYAIGEKLP